MGTKCTLDRIERERELARTAGEQHGVVSRKQLLVLGFTAKEITGRIARGRLLAVHRGVYAVGRPLSTQHGRWMAAVLACGEGAVLSHWSAAALLGIAPRRAMRPDVTRPTYFRARPRIACHRSSVLADEWEIVEGIPTTALARTLFDLAAIGGEREVERAFHEAEVRRLTDRISVPQLLERYPGRRGAPVLRKILASKRPAGISRNDFEELFVAFLDRHGLPRGLMNGTLPLRGKLFSPDCMWPEQRLVAELDSREVHGTDRAFQGDRKRDRILLAEGWRTTRITCAQLRDEPGEVAADLRRLLST
jgi:predicted transcriptional regulator of viral defense system